MIHPSPLRQRLKAARGGSFCGAIPECTIIALSLGWFEKTPLLSSVDEIKRSCGARASARVVREQTPNYSNHDRAEVLFFPRPCTEVPQCAHRVTKWPDGGYIRILSSPGSRTTELCILTAVSCRGTDDALLFL